MVANVFKLINGITRSVRRLELLWLQQGEIGCTRVNGWGRTRVEVSRCELVHFAEVVLCHTKDYGIYAPPFVAVVTNGSGAIGPAVVAWE